MRLAVLLAAISATVAAAAAVVPAPRRGSGAAGDDRPAPLRRRRRRLQAEPLTPIEYATYGQMVERMQRLAATAPRYVRLWSAQQRYGLASPGQCADAGGAPTSCMHWVLEITDFDGPANATAVGSGAGPDSMLPGGLATRPQVFLSGNLHGDEQVGPMTLITLAEHMTRVLAAGASPWIARLAASRRLLVMPMTNPLGFSNIVRTENGMDPNRDFPFNQDPAHCMTTLTARVINEVWRSNLVTSAITFHGGMQAIAYEWGAENHMAHDSESPDDMSQYLTSHVMGNAAGAYRGERYPVNRINPLVYAVPGGMEDWAYAASWDSASVRPCTPSTYGGYPPEKTTYNAAVLRAFNVLIEASDIKRPPASTLGSIGPLGIDALEVEGDGDGHVPRNMRLTYAVIDLVAPYVQLTRFAVAGGAGATVTGSVSGLADGSSGSTGGARRLATDDAADADSDADLRAAMRQAYEGLQAAAAARREARRLAYANATAADQHSEGGARRLTRGQGTKPVTVGGYPPLPRAGTALVDAPAGPCTGGPAACQAHRSAYAQWVALPATTGTAGTVNVSVGWDVGGALAIDASSVIAGSWDARVPPSFLTAAFVYHPDNPDVAIRDSTKLAAAARLVSDYGLSIAEAGDFVDYVHAWQQFLAGAVPLTGTARGMARYSSPPATGVSRWVFRTPLGAQPTADADGAPVASAGARVRGAPRLMSEPYGTRFADCVAVTVGGRVPALGDCGSPPASTGTPPAGAGVHAFVFVPYAVVDSNWRDQVSPDPPNTPPQSHLVNARTNADWYHENGGYVVQGRLHAVAEPLFVAVEAGSPAPVPSASATATVPPPPPPPPPSPSSSGSGSPAPPAPASRSPAPAASSGAPTSSPAAAAGAGSDTQDEAAAPGSAAGDSSSTTSGGTTAGVAVAVVAVAALALYFGAAPARRVLRALLGRRYSTLSDPARGGGAAVAAAVAAGSAGSGGGGGVLGTPVGGGSADDDDDDDDEQEIIFDGIEGGALVGADAAAPAHSSSTVVVAGGRGGGGRSGRVAGGGGGGGRSTSRQRGGRTPAAAAATASPAQPSRGGNVVIGDDDSDDDVQAV